MRLKCCCVIGKQKMAAGKYFQQGENKILIKMLRLGSSLKNIIANKKLLLCTAVGTSGLVISKNSDHEVIKSSSYESELENYWNISKSFAKDVRKRFDSTAVVRFGRAAFTVLSVIIDYKYVFWKYDESSEKYSTEKSKCHLRSALKLRELCCINGGIFIKVGQHIGALDYLLPEEYVKTMKVLHTDAPQSSFEDVKQVVEEELNGKLNDMFTSFSETPIGSASLAQVHKAALKDGRVLALKVQHRDVRAHSIVDMTTIEFLASVVAKLFPEFRFTWLVEEIQRNLPLELDFDNEGKNCELLGRMLKKFPYLKVPKIHWDLTTNRLLAMEFCEGGRVDDPNYIEKIGISKADLSSKLGRLYSEMIFVNGFVHCDPHPGNILVQKGADGKAEITMLDHGLYQTLSDDFRINYCKFWQALIRADVDAIKHYSGIFGVGDMHGLFACIISARSWNAVTTGMEKVSFTKQEVGEIQEFAVQYMPEITDVLNRIPRQMILLLKTNDLLRGIDSKLSTPKSLVTLSRCCIKAVMDYDLQNCDSIFGKVKIHFQANLDQFKITLYQLSLTIYGRKFINVFTYLYNSLNNVLRTFRPTVTN